MNNIKLPASQDKWIATGIWMVILGILVISSFGISASINTLLSTMTIFRNGFFKPPVWFYVSIALSAAAQVYFIARAWGRFFTFSKLLFLALGREIEEGESGSIFYPFLTFKKKGNHRSENATGSVVSSIIWSLALSYLMTMVELAFFIFSTLFLKP